MPKFAASLNLMFNEWPLLDRFAAARDAGFKAVEVQFPYAEKPDDIAKRLEATGLELVLMNTPRGAPEVGGRGIAAIPGRRRSSATVRYGARVHAGDGLPDDPRDGRHACDGERGGVRGVVAACGGKARRRSAARRCSSR